MDKNQNSNQQLKIFNETFRKAENQNQLEYFYSKKSSKK